MNEGFPIYKVNDFVEYIDPEDEENVFISKIVQSWPEDDGIEYEMADGNIVKQADILDYATEYEADGNTPKKKDSKIFKGDFADFVKEKSKMEDKQTDKEYIDVSDIPTMKPAERQMKIDKLLEDYNVASPEKKKQIEQQIKSLKASMKKESVFKFDNVEHYIDFIENTLAPDLVDSGYESTAEDFYTLANNIKEGYVDVGFMKFLEGTLIPDLKESGKNSTAEDFEAGIKYWKQAIKSFDKKSKDPKEQKKQASEKSSWSLDKKNSKIMRDEKKKIKALLLSHGETYREGQKVVLAACLGSEDAQIKQCLGKGNYLIELSNGIVVKTNKENIFPVNNEDLK